jgi:hypothetical protein
MHLAYVCIQPKDVCSASRSKARAYWRRSASWSRLRASSPVDLRSCQRASPAGLAGRLPVRAQTTRVSTRHTQVIHPGITRHKQKKQKAGPLPSGPAFFHVICCCGRTLNPQCAAAAAAPASPPARSGFAIQISAISATKIPAETKKRSFTPNCAACCVAIVLNRPYACG